MPLPTRWMIRCSLIYLLTGFLTGALLLLGKAYPVFSRLWILLPIHIEIMIFGFIIQFTLGTAYWILPRYLKGKYPRGNPTAGKLVAGLINLGIVLNVICFLNILPKIGSLIGRSLEFGSVILFVLLHWNRIVSYKNN
ncbi:MAG: hypothetical protein PVI44_06450 [Balneolaceae bacterium]|jgi:cbb3-type cytochrome oxidase subunit 1